MTSVQLVNRERTKVVGAVPQTMVIQTSGTTSFIVLVVMVQIIGIPSLPPQGL